MEDWVQQLAEQMDQLGLGEYVRDLSLTCPQGHPNNQGVDRMVDEIVERSQTIYETSDQFKEKSRWVIRYLTVAKYMVVDRECDAVISPIFKTREVAQVFATMIERQEVVLTQAYVALEAAYAAVRPTIEAEEIIQAMGAKDMRDN